MSTPWPIAARRPASFRPAKFLMALAKETSRLRLSTQSMLGRRRRRSSANALGSARHACMCAVELGAISTRNENRHDPAEALRPRIGPLGATHTFALAQATRGRAPEPSRNASSRLPFVAARFSTTGIRCASPAAPSAPKHSPNRLSHPRHVQYRPQARPPAHPLSR